MQGDIKKLRFYTKIGNFKIIVKFSTPLGPEKIPKAPEIQKAVLKEFDHAASDWENADNIKKLLQPFCYRVLISPQLQGLKYGYEIEI